MSAIESTLKIAFLVVSLGAGFPLFGYAVIGGFRGRPVSDWGIAFFAGSVGILNGAVFSVLLYSELRA